MDLNHLGRRDARLLALLQQSQRWRRLDEQIKQILPANLRAHFQTACVENGTLVLLAHNNMASSRLRMIAPGLLPQLQALCPGILQVQVKAVPKPPLPPRSNSLALGETARAAFRQSAAQLAHHPELAQALLRLTGKRNADGD